MLVFKSVVCGCVCVWKGGSLQSCQSPTSTPSGDIIIHSVIFLENTILGTHLQLTVHSDCEVGDLITITSKDGHTFIVACMSIVFCCANCQGAGSGVHRRGNVEESTAENRTIIFLPCY